MQKLSNITFGILALAVLMTACNKDKSSFTISGELNNPTAESKKVYLFVADSVQLSVVDSTTLDANNKFSFKYKSPYSNLFKVKAGVNFYDLIAEDGQEITLKADLADSTMAYEVSGSPQSERMRSFNTLNRLLEAKNSKLIAAYQAEAQKLGGESDSLLNIYMPGYLKNMEDYSNAVLKFGAEDKKSLASFYAITSLDQMKYESELVKYADEISDELKMNPGVLQFVKHIERIKPVTIGQVAPDFTLIDDQDKDFKLSDYKGKYIMIDFWASWCAPCRQENPNVVRLYNLYKDKGFNILGISLDEDLKAWQKAIKDDKLTWRHATEAQRFDGKVVQSYQVEAIPSTFIIDPEGKIIAKNLRGTELEEFLKKTFVQ